MPTPIRFWTEGVELEATAIKQINELSYLKDQNGKLIAQQIAIMPDAHMGMGCSIGTVFTTREHIIPSSTGVDLGCGMLICKTTLKEEDFNFDRHPIRMAIEASIPVGRSKDGRKGDCGAWDTIPSSVQTVWDNYLSKDFEVLCQKYPSFRTANSIVHLGTLGTGNHFIEVTIDETGAVWFLLHSGSRGIGNKIGTTFIALAKKELGSYLNSIPNKDLAFLTKGTKTFDDYIFAVDWAQRYAKLNRQLMMKRVEDAVCGTGLLPPFQARVEEIDCHHNYIEATHDASGPLFITRKGAVSARSGELGIIPGSMGAKSYIVEGLGNPDGLYSCSHGAGRRMSRTEAKATFTVEQHKKATRGIECEKGEEVLDETPQAYKDIDAVMKAQKELVRPIHTLHQILCVKGKDEGKRKKNVVSTT